MNQMDIFLLFKREAMHFFDSLPANYNDPGCGVCLEEYNSHVANTCLQMTCGHIFHKDCIVPWLNDHHRCPICQQKTFMAKPLNILISEAGQEALIEFDVLGKGFKIIIVALSVIAVCLRLLDWAALSVADYCPDFLSPVDSSENWDSLVLAGGFIIFSWGILKGCKHLLKQIMQPKAKEIEFYKPAD
jgi:hypothetical protein